MTPKTWKLVFEATAEKQLAKLPYAIRKRILDFLEKVHLSDNPKRTALQMTGHRRMFWRYRIGDYRVICRFEEQEMVIVVLKIGHRRDVYH
jgi:mRNA interferase RelE/StbE